MRTAFFEGSRSRLVVRWGLVLAVVLGVSLSLGSVAAFAAGEAHPKLGVFGSFSNPNGIAIDESSGDVYVADLATNTVYKFDASGNPVDFFALGSNALTGAPGGSFSFPESADGTPAAIAVDNSKSASDPSAGDLYVMDAGHGVIDKFSPSGEYLNQITGFTPATGSPANNELLGLAVDASGDVRVDTTGTIEPDYNLKIDVFDDFSANHLVATQLNKSPWDVSDSGVPNTFQETYGFAASATGDDYLLYRACSCAVKLGQQLAGLGRVDNAGSGDVAVATDPATGHLYADDQSSIAEWDTGAMNGSAKEGELGGNPTTVGVLVGAPFGSLSGSSGQGGIAVNGSTGEIYVSDPGAGTVEVFGSAVPAVTAGNATGVSEEAASLNGTVDPRVYP